MLFSLRRMSPCTPSVGPTKLFVAAAQLILIVVADTDDPVHRPIDQIALPGPAVHRHRHTDGSSQPHRRHFQGPPGWLMEIERKLLNDTMPTVPQHSHRLLVIDRQVIDQAHLLLLQALAGVEARGSGGRVDSGSAAIPAG